jgi:hypothetical protein
MAGLTRTAGTSWPRPSPATAFEVDRDLISRFS